MTEEEAMRVFTVRLPQPIRDGLVRIAATRGETVTDVVRRALVEYVRDAETDIRQEGEGS